MNYNCDRYSQLWVRSAALLLSMHTKQQTKLENFCNKTLIKVDDIYTGNPLPRRLTEKFAMEFDEPIGIARPIAYLYDMRRGLRF